MECFDSAATYARLHEKIVRSFAIDALERGAKEAEEFANDQAAAFLKEVIESPMESFDGLGLGHDVRITSKTVRGGVLVENERVLHLCVFRVTDNARGNGRGSRLVRSSQRGRRQ